MTQLKESAMVLDRTADAMDGLTLSRKTSEIFPLPCNRFSLSTDSGAFLLGRAGRISGRGARTDGGRRCGDSVAFLGIASCLGKLVDGWIDFSVSFVAVRICTIRSLPCISTQ